MDDVSYAIRRHWHAKRCYPKQQLVPHSVQRDAEGQLRVYYGLAEEGNPKS